MINLYFKDKCPYCSEFISERCDDYVIDTSYYAREMGNVFNVPGSTLSPEEWLQSTCVIELESLGADAYLQTGL